MSITTDGHALLPELVALRRALHSAPEVGLHLPNTQATVLAELDGLGLEITTGTDTTSVVAVLRGAHGGPVVLLRGDMDGLPVVEQTGLPFASANGAMHACGHDLHTAALVGAARLLSARRDELHGSVIFMFQPGEEGYGGAKIMLEEGVLEAAGTRPVAAYGIHVITGPNGVFSMRPGPAMASSSTLRIRIVGEGGHGSQPASAFDPVPALTETVSALQSMVTRRFSVFDPVVLTVTQLSAGEAINVIPESASLGATVRALSDESLATLAIETERIATGIAAAHRCRAEVEFETVYPVTKNDAGTTAAAMMTLSDVFGPGRVEVMSEPRMGSEDFSFVLHEVPGTFVFLQATPSELDPSGVPYNHSPRVLFDDSVLGDQSAALAALALSHLGVSATA
jgi:hippurate hydrolase